jgi:carboxypeptidase D
MRLLLLGAALSSLFVAERATAQDPYRYLRLPQRVLDPETVRRTGFVRDHSDDRTFALGYVPRDRELPDSWRTEAVELDAAEVARRGIDLDTLRYRLPADRAARGTEGYHTYDTLSDELDSLAGRYPTLARRFSAGRSVEGRELWYLRLASPSGRESGIKLLYVSSMHGDEVTGKELLVYLARDLLGGYGSDPRATALLDRAELFLMPSMNPDGTEARRRWNARGVDLNRNFPEMNEPPFVEDGRAPETIALMRLFQSHHFQLALNFHGGAVVMNLPWDHRSNPAGAATNFGDDALLRELAREYARANPPMHANNGGSFQNGVTYGYEWYQVLGGMQDWSNFFRQATHATVELSQLKWPPASQLPALWRDNRESLLRFLERGLEGIHLKVVDERGEPVPVTVEVSSSRRALHFPDGRVHRPTLDGLQRVRLRAPGHRSLELESNRWRFDGEYRTVVLARTPSDTGR